MPYALCPMPYALCPMPSRTSSFARKAISLLFLLINFSRVKKTVLFFIPELMAGEAEGNVCFYK
jgi:hypothetical protein